MTGDVGAASTTKRVRSAQARRKNMNVRFDDAEFASIAAAALRAGVSPTAYVGMAAVTAADTVPVPLIPESLAEPNKV